MTKREMVGLTLDQLIATFQVFPECFDLDTTDLRPYVGSNNEAIIWRHRVEIDKTYIQDPNNPSRTVIVFLSKKLKEIQCHIYLRDIDKVQSAASITADANVTTSMKYLYFWDENYKKFEYLKELIINRNKNRERDKFLNKLHSVFPGTFDEYLFGKKP